MRATGPSVVIIQHLKSLGIKLRMPKKTISPDVQRKSSSGGLFGVPLQSLPPSAGGEVPQLVVDICQFLSYHLSAEGLFRKSGSVNRIKTLKVQLESGETSLSSAHPSDVAALLKQFFRELPQPLLTPELQDPLCQIQQTLCEEERGSATTLVTCLLPPAHGETLRYFCTFLQNVASRCDENRMDSGNLAVVLAPSLFSSSNLGEKLTLATEKQLQLQASAIQSLIERAQDIGQVPSFILEKISLPCDAGEEDSVSQNPEGLRRRRRRSMSGIVNDALNKLKSGLGPSSLNTDRASGKKDFKAKRKASEDSGCAEFCTPKKRKSLRETTDEHVDDEDVKEPCASRSPLTGSGEVFSDFAVSPGDFLDLNSESPAVPSTPDSSSRGQKGRNKRRNSKRVKRMHSGLISVSPAQLDRKEKVRNSLRIFNRARTTKQPQPNPECKSLEQTGWHLMKKMVADALDGPFFNGKDFRVALKTSNSVDTPGNRDSSLQTQSSPPSLMSSPSLKLLALGSEEVEAARSSKKRRTLRRSLSMPEKVGECVQGDGDQEPFLETSLTLNKEGRSQDDGLNFSADNAYIQAFDGDPLKYCLNTDNSQDVPDQVSVGEQSSPHPIPPLRRPNGIGHTSQYRSVRKLVLSFPWVPSISDLDPQQKDWEKLATHTIRRKGARRFGRSLSQECGLRSNGDQIGFKRSEDNVGDGNSKFLSARNRQVFVSRKNITLSHWGQHSLELGHQVSFEDTPIDTERQLLDTPLSLEECPLTCCRLEPISDTVDLEGQ
ncbi:PREDICTED: rho GTPase-activating protein 11A-like [Nanorana parkeri]|uniref:rho GTPase-activating protein 11A-like n=1 Tax=Nanorana parkeri TaxID=125878 RepID=UPI000854600A|nr:PREDICTED: rho GTPase-activating protein 11A-like [Nanorana parkeri]